MDCHTYIVDLQYIGMVGWWRVNYFCLFLWNPFAEVAGFYLDLS